MLSSEVVGPKLMKLTLEICKCCKDRILTSHHKELDNLVVEEGEKWDNMAALNFKSRV